MPKGVYDHRHYEWTEKEVAKLAGVSKNTVIRYVVELRRMLQESCLD